MEVVRKQLAESQISPPNIRFNSGTDTVQFSPDDGANWYDTPSADPRHSDAFRLPPLGTDTRCDAAANMVKWIKDFLDRATDLLGDGATALTLLNTAIPLYELISGGSLTLLAIVSEFCQGLFSLGYTVLLAAMDTTAYDALLCCFYCNIGNNGQVSAGQLSDVEAQVTTDLNTTAGIVVNAILALQGEVGVSNAGKIGGLTGDCSGCACCPDGYCTEIDFHASNGGFTASLGTWSAGVGWVHGTVAGDGKNYRGVWLHKTVTAGNIKKISIEFSESAGSFFTAQTDRIYYTADSPGNWIATHAAGSTPSPFVFVGDINGKTVIGFTLTCGFSTPASGSLTVTKITFEGDDCTVAPGYVDCL